MIFQKKIQMMLKFIFFPFWSSYDHNLNIKKKSKNMALEKSI